MTRRPVGKCGTTRQLLSCILFYALSQASLVTAQIVGIHNWECLNRTVGGRLLAGSPFSKYCFSGSGSLPSVSLEVFNSASCLRIRDGYFNETLRSGTIGGYINTQWETCQTTGEQCLLNYGNVSDPSPVLKDGRCFLGSVPQYFIDIGQPEHVSAAFEFSRVTGVPLVVKNTGHDYKGRSSAPNSLALWTHNLKTISYNESFIPDGCAVNRLVPAVTMGAGVQFQQLYDFAEEHNITVMGGDDPGVGASGGWVQGGGHGGLANTMGLGVDRVLQFKIVTPDGNFRIVNACQNQDLFFALRGGGGGTFGVVLESTTLAAPRVTLQAAAVIFNQTDTNTTRDLWSILIDNGLRWVTEGWGGFVTANSALWVTPALNVENANISMQPLFEFGRVLQDEGRQDVQILFAQFPSFGTFFNEFALTNSAELAENLALASRLIPEENFLTAQSKEDLLSALMSAYSLTPGLRLIAGSPYNYKGDHGTSVTPLWRKTVYHATLIAPWNWNASLEEKGARYKLVGRSVNYLRAITPDAAYSNEADVHEPNHEVSFWGEHYSKLLQIKKKYDPDLLLDCWHCVGWEANSPRYSCYI